MFQANADLLVLPVKLEDVDQLDQSDQSGLMEIQDQTVPQDQLVIQALKVSQV